ncbi:hypothetical protein AYX14_06643 [Cryptococcus neoformans]|nr:hypothetical protein AYX14_06643 [Cryptococcus neoformans var. grubii]
MKPLARDMSTPNNRQAQQPRFFFPPTSATSSPATLNLGTSLALSRQTSRSSRHGHGQNERSGHRRRATYGREHLHSRLESGMPFGDERNSTESLGSDGTEFQIQEALTTSIILDKDQQVVAFQPRFQGRARTPSPNPTEMDIMDALTDIHRVLYLGEEFLDQEGSKKSWEQKVESLRKVIEQYFEGDCVYDTPLVRLTSSSSLLSHFSLLHLLSTLTLPSLTPSAVIRHARSLTSALMLRLVGGTLRDVDPVPRFRKRDTFGERRFGARSRGDVSQDGAFGIEEAWLSLATMCAPAERDGEDGWWKLWEVRAECSEIGEMECYDGYRLAMIDHIISLHLLPSLTRPLPSESTTPSSFSSPSPLSTPSPSSAHLPGALSSLPAPTFVRRLVGTLANELDLALKWKLPMTTVVEINEVGKATYIRDIIDLRDAVETFVPFAKRFGWLTRSLTGIVSSVLGDVIVRSILPKREERIEATINVETVETAHRASECIAKSSSREGSNTGISAQGGQRENSLGLQNLGSGSHMAPDVDDEALAIELKGVLYE